MRLIQLTAGQREPDGAVFRRKRREKGEVAILVFRESMKKGR